MVIHVFYYYIIIYFAVIVCEVVKDNNDEIIRTFFSVVSIERLRESNSDEYNEEDEEIELEIVEVEELDEPVPTQDSCLQVILFIDYLVSLKNIVYYNIINTHFIHVTGDRRRHCLLYGRIRESVAGSRSGRTSVENTQSREHDRGIHVHWYVYLSYLHLLILHGISIKNMTCLICLFF